MTRNTAEARLFNSIGNAFRTYAADLADLVEDPEFEEAAGPATADLAADHNLGKRQRQIVDVPGLADETGLKTSEIANAIGYEVPNTYSTLQALARQKIVEQVPDSDPQRWRLARRYRPNAEAFRRMAGHVCRGEWATYGDIAIAVTGSNKAARGVGRTAATDPAFPKAHRILMDGGVINPRWQDGEGGGPEVARARLEEEGVVFPDGERADRSQRVTWDELLRRDARGGLDSA